MTKVDEVTCIGCGLCETICPEVFVMNNDSGKSEVRNHKMSDKVKEAIKECPVDAIS